MARNEVPEINFDLDALQAEINMAMAETQAVVSSWVKPTINGTTRPKKSFQEMEKELQEYMRRPPRLGVGHPIPEQIGPSAREEAKLKNKLVGNGKKRKRERDDVVERKHEEGMEEEEEESRKGESNSSAKIGRFDPFSFPKKKEKRKDEAGKPVTNGLSLPLLNLAGPPPSDTDVKINGAAQSPSPSTPSSPSKKKRRRRRKKKRNRTEVRS